MSTAPALSATTPSAAPQSPLEPKHPVRLVTAAALFDGHDAAINIMRRLLQSCGAEVIHLGHNRSVQEIVECAVQEDAQGIAVTSYQGGHVEYLKYMVDLLRERGRATKVFAGGGGTILPSEARELEAYGVERIYSPDDGRAMGLQGMINDVIRRADFPVVSPGQTPDVERILARDPAALARAISYVENLPEAAGAFLARLEQVRAGRRAPVLGITGTGGAGKSSLVDEFVRRCLQDYPQKRLAILSVDPTKRRTGGALLGDRIRMNAISDGRVYMRSMATRGANQSLSKHVKSALGVLQAAGFDLILVESSGIGQSDTEITEHCDVSLYVMTAEYGAATQLEKIDMLDFADVVAINKFDKLGSLDALRDVRKQWKRNRGQFQLEDAAIPVYGTIASKFADPGMNSLYAAILEVLQSRTGVPFSAGGEWRRGAPDRSAILPPERQRYLSEIVAAIESEERLIARQADLASQLYQLQGSEALLGKSEPSLAAALAKKRAEVERQQDGNSRAQLGGWNALVERYSAEQYTYEVRGKPIHQPLTSKSLSGLTIRKVALPRYRDWGDRLRWLCRENVPGEYPYTAGVFPLKREGEDPARMFAGEGGPERTNKRFHYVSAGMPAKRLSTAFDSVTLYGEDPDRRPDIYGKIGNSGVSIASLDDAKKLYSGFDLCDPKTSVSMTINGPAPMLLGFFLNAAIDQRCERYIRAEGLTQAVTQQIEAEYQRLGQKRPHYRGELPKGNDGLGLLLLGTTGDRVLPREVYERLAAEALQSVRGTVQADILKEDQAQNTCIFSTEFALRMMGDIQQHFIERNVRNFYSVSISGYHIAEAGANPITQLAFTLANGFTFVEYYLARGMAIDDFAPNLSFFFSNGLDPEYAVIGRVARRIWARAMRNKYGANERSQKLKYHIQTSGRSLHAQEIAFNDIRTTLQALYALYDNCNSLHTNAYDEAITTPTEESVRRAMAIQLIINKELGQSKNENPLQGSFIIEELTDLVEEAVLAEFQRLSERGGVLGAMERMYQRSKIQDESLYYEQLKHDGSLPVIGVNTFLDPQGSPTIVPAEVIRSTEEEKEFAIACRDALKARYQREAAQQLADLKQRALAGKNLFVGLMEASKVCTLGSLSSALYEVGGQYRRNM